MKQERFGTFEQHLGNHSNAFGQMCFKSRIGQSRRFNCSRSRLWQKFEAISLWVDNGGRLILFGSSADNFMDDFSIEMKN